MLTTTFSQLRDLKACQGRYDHLANTLGDDYGDETPIPLLFVFDICGKDDVAWLLTRLYIKCNLDLFDFGFYMCLVCDWEKELQDDYNNI